MAIERMDHVNVVVENLREAIDFFEELGLELQGDGTVEGAWVDRVIGLEGVRADIAMLETADGHGRVELSEFHAPDAPAGESGSAANTLGIRHIAFGVEDLDGMVDGLRARGVELVGTVERYGSSFRLCYVRGPEGIIVELAERLS